MINCTVDTEDQTLCPITSLESTSATDLCHVELSIPCYRTSVKQKDSEMLESGLAHVHIGSYYHICVEGSSEDPTSLFVENMGKFVTHAVAYIHSQASTSMPAMDDSPLLNKVRRLVVEGQVEEARRILKVSFSGGSQEVEYWRRVLALPQARVERSATGGELKCDHLWLRRNSKHYLGKWVALKDGLLLGSHDKRIELHRQLKRQDQLAGAVFVKIPNK